MANVYRANRKASDADIIRLNSVGLSLGTIARALEIHPSTVTLRLKSLKIPPADTRRAFMEDIVLSLTQDQQEWLAGEMSNGGSIKDYVRQLIVERYQNNQPRGSQNDP